MTMNRSFVVLPLSNPPFYDVCSFNSWSVRQASSTFGRRFDPESSARSLVIWTFLPPKPIRSIWLLTPFLRTFGRRMMIGQQASRSLLLPTWQRPWLPVILFQRSWRHRSSAKSSVTLWIMLELVRWRLRLRFDNFTEGRRYFSTWGFF